MQKLNTGIVTIALLVAVLAVQAEEVVVDVVDLTAFPVYAGSVWEGSTPAAQLSDRMAREVRVDLQSRGGTRYQTDISIRGGIFEGTGLMVGGLSLFDPQTGHYFSEIPLDPSFFGGAYLLTGVENGIQGFNSTAGTIEWKWAPIVVGGSAYARVGTDSAYGGGVRVAGNLDRGSYELAVTREQGDGSIEYGDFDFKRISGRYEQGLGTGTLRLFGGYVDKFYGWPRMYTGFPLNETDDYSVSLLGWQWETGTQTNGFFHRVGGYWREVDDDYEYTRETPNAFFEHKTEVFSLQGDGVVTLNTTKVIYRWAYVQDAIVRSTSLVNGHFSERRYGEGAVLARQDWETSWGEWAAYGGMGLDSSNEDSTVGLPQVGLSASGISDGAYWKAYLEYSETSQVPGYTVLNSGPSGLFGGNADLERERAETIEAGVSYQQESIIGKLVVFRRQDKGLVDWVYSTGSPTARRAAPVDMEVSGLEGLIRWDGKGTSLELGFAWLNKDENYNDTSVDASYYALNFAKYRLLLTLEQAITDAIVVRFQGEYRKHPDNLLRTGGDEALRLNVEVTWKDFIEPGWNLTARLDNLTKEDFQSIPGTPAPGREGVLTLSYDW